MTRRPPAVRARQALLLAGFLGLLLAAHLPSLLAESELRQLGGIATSLEHGDGYGRRALRSTPPAPPIGSSTSISFQLQFDGLTLADSAVDGFKAAYCADLVSATREASSFCHVSEISPSQPSGLLVTTGLYYPEPVPATALFPDTLAAGFVVSPSIFFSAGFKEAYGKPTRGENVVVNSVYVPPPPMSPVEPPSPPPPPVSPSASGSSGANGTPQAPPFMWWEISPPPPIPKPPPAPPQPPAPAPPKRELPPIPAWPPAPPRPPPPAPSRPGESSELPVLEIPLSPATVPSPPAPSTPGAPPVPAAPGMPMSPGIPAVIDPRPPTDAAGAPPAPSQPGSPAPTSQDQKGCAQMAEIESLLTSQIKELEGSSAPGSCDLGCLTGHFPTTSVNAPALQCTFNTVKCLDARMTGHSVEPEFLSTLLRLLSCTMGGIPETSGNGGSPGTSGGSQGNSGNGGSPGTPGGSQDTFGNGGSQMPWDTGTLDPFLEAIQAVIESPAGGDASQEIACDVMFTLRLLSETELRAILDAIERKDASATVLDTVGMALEKFAPRPEGSSLAGYSDPVTGASDQSRCSHFPWSLNRIFYEISEAVLTGMLIAGETEYIGPDLVRLMLTLQEIPDDSGLEFSFPAVDDGNGRRRHRALAAIESSSPTPKMAMPRSFSDACIQNTLVCSLPLPISLSYTAESDYLMQGLGTATFVSAAADFANVTTAGLMVATVSGTIGIRLPLSTVVLSTGLLGTSALLSFPLDGQVAGALGQDGKLCMRIDYDLMLPVVIGRPEVENGIANCVGYSAGDYLVVQLAYALEDKGNSLSTYVAPRVVQVDPMYENELRTPRKRLWTLLYACLLMVAAAIAMIVVMWMRRAPPSSEDEDAWMYEGEEEDSRNLLSPSTPDKVVVGGAFAQQANKPISPNSIPFDSIRSVGLDVDASQLTTPGDPAFRKVSSLVPSLPSRSRDSTTTTPGGQSTKGFRKWSSLVPSPSSPPQDLNTTPGASSPKAFKRWTSLLPMMSLPRRPSDEDSDTGMAGAAQQKKMALPSAIGDEQTIQKIVKMHVQGRRDRNGRTALHLAIAKRNLTAVQALTQPLGKHQSPLGESIFSDGSMQDARMRNPLHTAAEIGDLEIFDHLLKLAGNAVQQAISLRDLGGNTALHIAARKGSTNIIAALQQIPGCDLKINLQNRDGWTPLQLAASRGELEAIVQLLKSNPDIDLISSKEPRGLKDIVSSRRTALHMASMLGRRDIVRALLNHMHKAANLEQGIENIEPVGSLREFSFIFQKFAANNSFSESAVPEPEKEEEVIARTITMASMRKIVARSSSARRAAGPPRRHNQNGGRRDSAGSDEALPNEGDVFLDDVTTDD